MDQATIELPSWARVSERREGHIQRVTALLNAWSAMMRLPPEETRTLLEVGMLHDALRDAPEADLRTITGDSHSPVALLHGPAAAIMLERNGERRTAVLDAIRYHTVGYADWGMTGKALYMADFLEPGRGFSRQDRYFLSLQVPTAFDGVFRQVVRIRLEWTIRDGHPLLPETVRLWNSLQ